MNSIWGRALMPAAVIAGGWLSPAHAQQPAPQPQPAAAESVLRRGSRPSFRHSTAAPATARRADQLRKFEEVRRQPAGRDRPPGGAGAARRLRRATASSCCSAASRQQCGPLNNKIQQMRGNLDRIQSDIERLRGDAAPEREGQRRAILVALAQNNCGAQYQQQVAATPPPRGGLFESLFGPKSVFTPGSDAAPGMSAAERHLPHRLRAHLRRLLLPDLRPPPMPGRFAEDEKTCRAVLPGRRGPALLAPQSRRGHQPGGVGRRPSSPTRRCRTRSAIAPRSTRRCSCRRARRNLVAGVEEHRGPTVEQGDIVVNDQRARQLSQPRVDAQGKPIKPVATARPDPRAAQTARPHRRAAPAAPPMQRPTSRRRSPIRTARCARSGRRSSRRGNALVSDRQHALPVSDRRDSGDRAFARAALPLRGRSSGILARRHDECSLKNRTLRFCRRRRA